MNPRLVCTVLFALSSATEVQADDQRTKVNYMIHCQGCHLPHAVGVPGTVPGMNEFMGYFLYSQKGREYLVRVPGVATSSLADDEIAELLNWLIVTYSADQAPDEFEPYSEVEVASLRRKPEPDPAKTRQLVLNDIAAEFPPLKAELTGAE